LQVLRHWILDLIDALLIAETVPVSTGWLMNFLLQGDIVPIRLVSEKGGSNPQRGLDEPRTRRSKVESGYPDA